MMTVLLALIVVLLSIGGLAVGVLAGRAPLRCSCRGLPPLADCVACPKHRQEQG